MADKIKATPLMMSSKPVSAGNCFAAPMMSPHTVKGTAQPAHTNNPAVIAHVRMTYKRSGSRFLTWGAAGASGGGTAAATGAPHFQHATAWSGRVVWQ